MFGIKRTKNSIKRKILMTGRNGAGKSTLFHRLTDSSSEPAEKSMLSVYDVDYELIVLPDTGTSTVSDEIRSGKYSADETPEQSAPILIVVIDATDMKTGLHQAFGMIDSGFPVIIVINKMDLAEEQGIHIDINEIQHILGVPVVPVTATTGEGIENLADMLRKARTAKYCEILSRLKGEDAATVATGCTGCIRCSLFGRKKED